MTRFPDKNFVLIFIILSVDGTGVTVPMDRINENKEYARVRTNKDCTDLAYQFMFPVSMILSMKDTVMLISNLFEHIVKLTYFL